MRSWLRCLAHFAQIKIKFAYLIEAQKIEEKRRKKNMANMGPKVADVKRNENKLFIIDHREKCVVRSTFKSDQNLTG